MIARDGFTTFAHDAGVARWAEVAGKRAAALAQDPTLQAANLRHGKTWFVGVDVLPNAVDGSVDGVVLNGAWRSHVPDMPLHPAQVSIIYPGYPLRDADESDANHRFRRNRSAAHVDGLLPHGPARRRFPIEFHSYILGLPLTSARQAPTVVWRGSHEIMQAALRDAIGDRPPATVDVTEAYQAARREVFATCEKVALPMAPGEAMLIHRFALHGTDPWEGEATLPNGRMIAFFRPQTTPEAWLGWDAPA